MSRKHAFIAETAVSWVAVSTGLNARYNWVSSTKQCIEGKWWLTIEKNHSCEWRTKAGLNRSLDARHTWSIVSKAALRSRNTSKVTCCSFIFISISFHTCSRAVPYCETFSTLTETQNTVERKTCCGIIADPLLFRSLWRQMSDYWLRDSPFQLTSLKPPSRCLGSGQCQETGQPLIANWRLVITCRYIPWQYQWG